MKDVISFSTSQFSSASRIFSQEASSDTHTVEAILANDHNEDLVKSSRSSSRSWNFCVGYEHSLIGQRQEALTSQAAFHSLFHLPVVSSSTFTAAS